MNHNGNANKMVRDTPRTETYVLNPLPQVVSAEWARQLERELVAANDRIKRLEEAGDALKASGYFGGFGDAVNKWIKVKEDKP